MNDGKKFYSLESEIEIILEKSKCLLLIKSSILIQTCLLMEIMVYRFYPSVLYGRRTLSLFDMAPCGSGRVPTRPGKVGFGWPKNSRIRVENSGSRVPVPALLYTIGIK